MWVDFITAEVAERKKKREESSKSEINKDFSSSLLFSLFDLCDLCGDIIPTIPFSHRI